MKVFISTHMLMLKFPTLQGTGTVRGDQLGSRSCYASAVKSTNRPPRREAFSVITAPLPPRTGIEQPKEPMEESFDFEQDNDDELAQLENEELFEYDTETSSVERLVMRVDLEQGVAMGDCACSGFVVLGWGGFS
ncbi:PREDICTED: LOC110773229 [Prunus dulcis]|uniref:PREDICTED: LOC110773229 n=1 Tax=Prunus dulcis TaxID=3755 RepID=A0A5E4FJX2_PRUDU|nr:PREDICTED: LOC110773229 [Prunus dulcis]